MTPSCGERGAQDTIPAQHAADTARGGAPRCGWRCRSHVARAHTGSIAAGVPVMVPPSAAVRWRNLWRLQLAYLTRMTAQHGKTNICTESGSATQRPALEERRFREEPLEFGLQHCSELCFCFFNLLKMIESELLAGF